ncbi:ABC transporter ATP-binding protein [Halogeometricum sp. CBA1124]|uniref:ABC transporter ATP-binding protein n=1 Tax=Halogeometricum sp. CBA1124 TaxID=2668071 RepID=UPI00142B57EB|nr:ABC transporter ATP-binding protein [Halogeometricum sp. CBA1124]MUV56206.1 ATP-binding cassette domain-containing protein [Halogeometricum sp. CBA1124]
MTDTILEVENLRTQFFTEEGVVQAVDGVSFNVERGEILGIVGESGAGKSVAARSILRLIDSPGAIVGGRITFNGQLLFGVKEEDDGEVRHHPDMLSETEMREQVRGRDIAIIFQDPMESLNPVFTVGEQLQEFIEYNRDLGSKAANEVAIEMLREVGIPKPENRFHNYPHQFSGGMRQRVLIAMALACEPELIIADEPTTALDVTVESQILDLVSDLQDRYDTSFIWVTHDMGVVAEICDRVNVMYLGEIVEQSAVSDLFKNPQHPYTEALLRSIPRPDERVEELEPIAGVMPEAINPPSGCRFHTRCPEARAVCREHNPAARNVSEEGARRHRAACLKHESVFGAGYEGSEPLERHVGGGFGVGLTGETDPAEEVTNE